MANVGFATMQVIPSLRGMEREINSQLGRQLDAASARSGASSGRSFGSRFASAVGGLVRGVGRTIESGLTAVGTVAGIGLGTALVKGFGRLTAIQDATAALTISLGDSAAAGKLLAQVLDVVRGTPFNLDQFATAAQRLAGMGIEAAKIPRVLTAIGEAASTQGRNANEFVERLTRVFGQISAQGRVTGEDILQISETGVNALAILGNAFGVTTDEMREMVSRGAVPATAAIDILTEGILKGSEGTAGATVALGGTMAALRETLSGAAGGFSSALARFGANIIEPFVPLLTKALQVGADLLDEFGAKVADFGATIEGRFPIFDRVFDRLADLGDDVGPLVSKLSGLGTAFAPLIGAIGGLAAKNIAGTLGPLGLLVPTLGPLAGAIAGLVAVSPELRDALVEIGQAMAPIVGQIIEGLQPAFEGIIPIVTVVAGAVGDLLLGVLERVGPIIPKLADTMLVLADALAQILPSVVDVGLALLDGFLPAVEAMLPVVEALAPVVADVATAIADLVAAVPPGVITAIAAGFLAFKGAEAGVAGVKAISDGVRTAVDAMRGGVGTVSSFASGLANAGRGLAGIAGSIASGAANIASGLASLVANSAKAAAAFVANVARMIAQWVLLGVQALLHAGKVALAWIIATGPIGLLVAAVAAAVALIIVHWDTIVNAIQTAANAVIGFLKRNWTLVLALITGPVGLAVLAVVRHWEKIKGAFKAAIDAVVGFVRGLPGRIVAALASLGRLLASTMSQAFSRFRTAAVDGVNRVLSVIRSIPGRIIGAIGNLGRILYQAGRNVIGGFIDGIKSRIGDVGRAVSGIASKVRGYLPFSPAKEGPLRQFPPDRAGAVLVRMFADGIRSELAAVGATMRAGLVGVLPDTAAPIEVRATADVARLQGAATATVVINGEGLDRRLLEWLRHSVRVESGGNVQAALGQ